MIMYKLEISNEDVYRYLGILDGKIDVETKNDIDEAVKELKKYAKPKVEYKVFDIVKERNGIQFIGTNMNLEGESINKLLDECDQCILMAVTLGHDVDVLLRKLQISKLEQAVVVDFCASSMVEELCNQAETIIRNKWENQKKYLTDRFSPGYGDLSIERQKLLCEVLDTSRKMGISVGRSGMMNPKKSITAIVGISKEKQKMKIKGCQYCGFYKDCEYRKGGKICD